MMLELKDQKDYQIVQIAEGISGLIAHSESKLDQITLQLKPNEMLWVCSNNGNVQIESNLPFPDFNLKTSESRLLLNPKAPWSVDIKNDHYSVLCFIISLSALHDVLSADYDEEKRNDYKIDYSKIAKVISLSPKLLNGLSSIFNVGQSSPFQHIEKKGNFLIAFSTMLEKLFGTSENQCPFQLNRETEEKLRFVRNKIVNNLQRQPDLQNLSFEVNIPKSILKQGFQHVYGKSIYTFYHDYRMDKAISLLENGQHLVKEIAFEIGYQNPSHFIAAFKKRNGCTPKQYMKNY